MKLWCFTFQKVLATSLESWNAGFLGNFFNPINRVPTWNIAIHPVPRATLKVQQHISHLAEAFDQSDLQWETQSRHYAIEIIVSKIPPCTTWCERQVLLGERVLMEDLCLQELFEGREGFPGSDHTWEVLPPLGEKVWEKSGMPCLFTWLCQEMCRIQCMMGRLGSSKIVKVKGSRSR